MAQVNITLSQEEVVEVLTGNRDQAIKKLLERILNEVMKAESEEQLCASRHERTEERQDYRNGIRERSLNTRIGKLTLEVPRHRNEPFHTMIFEQYQRSEAALIATMVQMVISGVSTRKVENVVQTLCGTSFSKSTVSKLCEKLDTEVERYRNRSLEYINAPFIMLDATYFKVREDFKIKSKAFFVALAVKNDGRREILDFAVYDTEDNYSWKNFLYRLKDRGLKEVKMFISDGHKSIRHAIEKVYPESAWQRCQVHLLRNIIDDAPVKYKEGLKIELRSMFQADNIEKARAIKNEIVADYGDVAQKSMEALEKGFEDAMTIMSLPRNMRIVLRSTNVLERLNREFKRRSDVIQVFPNPESVLRLMGAVAIEQNESISTKQRIFTESYYKQNEESISNKLKNIAKCQLSLLQVA